MSFEARKANAKLRVEEEKREADKVKEDARYLVIMEFLDSDDFNEGLEELWELFVGYLEANGALGYDFEGFDLMPEFELNDGLRLGGTQLCGSISVHIDLGLRKAPFRKRVVLKFKLSWNNYASGNYPKNINIEFPSFKPSQYVPQMPQFLDYLAEIVAKAEDGDTSVLSRITPDFLEA